MVVATDSLLPDLAHVAFYWLSREEGDNDDPWDRYITGTHYEALLRDETAAMGFWGAATSAGNNAGLVHMYV